MKNFKKSNAINLCICSLVVLLCACNSNDEVLQTEIKTKSEVIEKSLTSVKTINNKEAKVLSTDNAIANLVSAIESEDNNSSQVISKLTQQMIHQNNRATIANMLNTFLSE